MSGQPSGTVTFLFTDIEGSTRLWDTDPDAMRSALARHDAILRDAIDRHNGFIFATGGDGFAVAFASAAQAVAAAASAQLELGGAALPRAWMGIHTGVAQERDGDYFGPTLNRAARLMAIGHGGQVLLSSATVQLVSDAAVRDLGEHRLRDLAQPERVFQLVAAGIETDFPPLRSLNAPRSNLPAELTSFVGRDSELDALQHMLEEHRIVTVTGVGGVGKTRLALQAGARVIADFPDGVWFVELAGVGEPDAIDDQIASALGVRPGPTQRSTTALVEFLRVRRALLIIDNCEHLVDAVARSVDHLAAGCAQLKFLATSREALAVTGERVFPVAALKLPFDDSLADLRASEAAQLFVARAQEVSPAFALTDANAGSVARLCRRLDGIPLAIELASARVRSLSPDEIASHLDRRFRLLTGGRRSSVTRQQTLRSAIDWSFDLLDDLERTTLRRLGIFSGTFDMAAVEAIMTGDDFDALDAADAVDRLVDKSLVIADTGSQATQYRLLEMIRDYAWEQLQDAGEDAAVSLRHARHYVEIAESASRGFRSAEELTWNARIDAALDNLRAALAWSISAGEVDIALRLVAAFAFIGQRHGAPFGPLAEEAARLDGAPEHPFVGVALACAAFTALNREGSTPRVRALADAGWQAAEHAEGPLREFARCRTFSALCAVFAARGDVAALRTLAECWLEDARVLGDAYELSQAWNLAAGINLDSISAAEEAVRFARLTGSPTALALSLMILGPALTPAAPDRAQTVFEEAIKTATAADNPWAAAFIRFGYAGLQLQQGSAVDAARTLLDAAQLARSSGELTVMDQALVSIAASLLTCGDADGAAMALAWSDQRGYVVNRELPAFFADLEALFDFQEARTAAERARWIDFVGQDESAIFALLEGRIDALAATRQ